MNTLQLFDNSGEKKTTTLHVSHARARFLLVHVFAGVHVCMRVLSAFLLLTRICINFSVHEFSVLLLVCVSMSELHCCD